MSNNGLIDYLQEVIKTFDMTEEEKKIILEYIKEIDINAKPLYKLLGKDENKIKVLTELKHNFSGGRKDV